MRRRPFLVAFLTGLAVGSAPAGAQSSSPGAKTSPSGAQLNLAPGAPVRPEAVPYAPAKPDSPVVQQLVGGRALVVRQRAARRHGRTSHVARSSPVPPDLERPALAGVTLLQPLPPVPQPPHVVVPLPAYPLETVAASYLTPAPAIVCHRTPRIRDLPDPRLYREETLVCEPDNP